MRTLAAGMAIAACAVWAQEPAPIGPGIKPPQPLSRMDPTYTEEARLLGVQGDVPLTMVVDETGKPDRIRVVRPLGFGLDEKAIEAVGSWRFLPAEKDGKAVPVLATFQVTFRLLDDQKLVDAAKKFNQAVAERRGDEKTRARG